MKFPFKEVVFDGGAVIELLLSGEESELFKKVDNLINSNFINI